jgi:hypothetical protein
MRSLSSSVFVVLLLTFVVSAQSTSTGLERIDLYSPFVVVGDKPSWNPLRARTSCLNLKLIPVQESCPSLDSISIGTRFGDNWDIFSLEVGNESRSRIIDIGKHEWGDHLKVPYVEPLRKLAKGETRGVTVNTSGTRAPDGKTYGQSTVSNQTNTAVFRADGGSQTDDYAPYVEAIKGHMYVVRVVQEKIDYYLLLRVDDIDRGERVSISYRKVKAPKKASLKK